MKTLYHVISFNNRYMHHYGVFTSKKEAIKTAKKFTNYWFDGEQPRIYTQGITITDVEIDERNAFHFVV